MNKVRLRDDNTLAIDDLMIMIQMGSDVEVIEVLVDFNKRFVASTIRVIDLLVEVVDEPVFIKIIDLLIVTDN